MFFFYIFFNLTGLGQGFSSILFYLWLQINHSFLGVHKHTSIFNEINSRGHPLSTCVKFSEKLTFLTPCTCAYQGVRNASFSVNLRTYVRNG